MMQKVWSQDVMAKRLVGCRVTLICEGKAFEYIAKPKIPPATNHGWELKDGQIDAAWYENGIPTPELCQYLQEQIDASVDEDDES